MPSVNLYSVDIKELLQNNNILKNFSEDEDGNLLYKGKKISSYIDISNDKISAYNVIEETDRKFVSSNEKTALSGIKDNIQSGINKINNINSWIAINSEPTNVDFNKILWIDNTDPTNPLLKWYNQNKWISISNPNNSGEGSASINDKAISESTTYSSKKIETLLDFAKIDDFNISGVKTFSSSKINTLLNNKAELNHKHNPIDIITNDDNQFVTSTSNNILEKLKITDNQLYFNDTLLGISPESFIDDTQVLLNKTYSSTKIDNLTTLLKNNKQDKLGYAPEDTANKNKNNGYVGLDNNGLIDLKYIPTDIKQQVYLVNNTAETLNLTKMIPGDFSYEKDFGNVFIYDGSKWILIASNKALLAQVNNNFSASTNPTSTDDIDKQYSIGSMWVNRSIQKGFICIDNTKNNAVWMAMAGQQILNIGEINEFKFDANSTDRTIAQDTFTIPEIDITKDFIMVFIDGNEKTRDDDYSVIDEHTIKFTREVNPNEEVNGAIFKQDILSAENNMRKPDYDFNNDGKVNMSDLSDISKQIQKWQPNYNYIINDNFIYNNKIYQVINNFLSASDFDDSNVNLLYTKPIDLKDFTTDDLVQSDTKLYMSPDNLNNINKITDIESNIQNINSNISNIKNIQTTITSKIPNDTSNTNQLINNNKLEYTIDNLKFTKLTDCPDTLISNTYVKVNNNGTNIELIANPHFPIQEIRDDTNAIFSDVNSIIFKKLEGIKFDSNILTLQPKLFSTDILDMPNTYEHGSILICNKDMLRYELHDLEDVIVSKENYQTIISKDIWIKDSQDSIYSTKISHGLDSDHLVIGIEDNNKMSINNVQYQIIDKNTIQLFSPIAQDLIVNINCSLGTLNSYWAEESNLAALAVIDDTRARTDKTWSSDNINNKLTGYMKVGSSYKKDESDLKYASKTSEHNHSNLNILNNLSTNDKNQIMYNNKILLTDFNPKIYNKTFTNESHDSSQLILDMNSTLTENNLNTIINSEIIIHNIGTDKLNLLIKDSNIILVNVSLEVNETQKYVLGISSNTQVFVQGTFEGNIYISAF